jgi:hypothetical protein
MSSYRPPPGVINEGKRWVIPAIAVVVLLAAIFVGGWKLHWWLAQSTVNHQTRIIQGSDSNQRALVADITEKIGDVTTATEQMDGTSGQQLADLHAQRLGFARQACNDAAQLSPADVLGDGVPQWIRANCTAGTVSPSSPLEGN